MKSLYLMGVVLVLAIIFPRNDSFAGEYFLVKSRSGILRIVDHKPTGGATIVKGPFKTMDEAEKAATELREGTTRQSGR